MAGLASIGGLGSEESLRCLPVSAKMRPLFDLARRLGVSMFRVSEMRF